MEETISVNKINLIAVRRPQGVCIPPWRCRLFKDWAKSWIPFCVCRPDLLDPDFSVFVLTSDGVKMHTRHPIVGPSCWNIHCHCTHWYEVSSVGRSRVCWVVSRFPYVSYYRHVCSTAIPLSLFMLFVILFDLCLIQQSQLFFYFTWITGL